MGAPIKLSKVEGPTTFTWTVLKWKLVSPMKERTPCWMSYIGEMQGQVHTAWAFIPDRKVVILLQGASCQMNLSAQNDTSQ